MTFYLSPSDIDNAVTWSRIGILGVASVLIPLIRPRTYVPVDPNNPTPDKDVLPEQTASLLSLIFHEYMTGLVWKAWQTTSLPYEQLVSCPLATCGEAESI